MVEEASQPLGADVDPDADLDRLIGTQSGLPRREVAHLLPELGAPGIVGQDEDQAERTERAEPGDRHHAALGVAVLLAAPGEDAVVEVTATRLLGRHLELVSAEP